MTTELDGATSPGERYAESANAGEFAARWNAGTEEQREKVLQGIKGLTREGARCFEQDHVHEIESMRAALAARATADQSAEEQLGKLIWETSRADEGTISVTGAKIIARSILAKFLIGAAADQVRAEALREAHGIISRRTGTYEAGIDLMERVAELEAEVG